MAKFLDTATITSVIGQESMGSGSATAYNNNSKARTFLGDFTEQSDATCLAIVNKYISPAVKSAHFDKAQIKKDAWEKVNKGIDLAAEEYSKNESRYNVLPADVKRLIQPIKTQCIALESALSKIPEGGSNKFALKFKLEQARKTMKSVLFTHFSNLYNRNKAVGIFGGTTPGLESYSYQDAILYPKLEAMTQWVNTTSAVYQKLIKIKQLVNEAVSVPVETQEVWIIIYDGAGNEVKRVKREELYNTTDPDTIYPNVFNEMKRTLVLKKEDFAKPILLKKTILTGQTTPFLSPNELVYSHAYLTNMKINGVDTPTGKIYDYKAGKMLSETFNEMDWKGKVIPYMPDPNKVDEIYYLSVLFDGAEQSLTFTVSPSKSSMPSIDEISIEFKMNDIYYTQKTNTDFEIRNVRSFIQAGAPRRIEINLNQRELDILDSRVEGEWLNKLINVASEFVVHGNDDTFFAGYKSMSENLKKEYETDPNFKLYAEQDVDMGLGYTVNRREALEMYLGSTFETVTDKLSVMANSHSTTQLNMFCHSLHLTQLKPVLRLITGTVEDDANGKFLGVEQDARVNVLTLGSDTSSPVNSIVVGTDKMNLMAKSTNKDGQKLAPGDIEYDYQILPYYKETNLETNLFVETPTRIVSDDAYRSNRRPFIPAMFVENSADFRVLRSAAAKVRIKGFLQSSVL